VVEHAAEAERQSVLGKELGDDRVEHPAVLVAPRIPVDGPHLRRGRSKRALHALLNVRAEIDVLDVQGAHAGACEAEEEGIERFTIVPEMWQERPDERVGLEASRVERREGLQPPARKRRALLQKAAQAVACCGDRQTNMPARNRGKEIGVAKDERGLGEKTNDARIWLPRENLQDLACKPILLLGALIGVGDRTEQDRGSAASPAEPSVSYQK